MAVLPATVLISLSAAAPSMADSSCKTVIVTIGIGCSQQAPPSSAPPANNSGAGTPARPTQPPQEAPVVAPPAPTPQPQTTVIIKEVPAAPAVPASAPAAPLLPASTAKPAVISPNPLMTSPIIRQTPKPAPTPSIHGEQASVNSASPDVVKQAGQVAPYIFFVGLAGLIAMLIIARSKKLFPFEKASHRGSKNHPKAS